MNPLIWINTSFLLNCGLLDIDLISMNSYVVLYRLFIDVIIVLD